MHPSLNIAIKAARKAGDIIARAFERTDSLKLSKKGRHDYTTEIDIKAEQEILYIINKAYPGHSIWAEESGYLEREPEYVWLVDPIDGTNNFIRGLPHFAVSIALQVNGVVEQAVIYDPIRQDLFTASKGGGAQLNERRLRIANQRTLDGAVISAVSPLQNQTIDPKIIAFWGNLAEQVCAMRRMGSAALDLAYVASSRIDGFCEMGLKPWDIAAGSLLVREAGGLVGDFSENDQYLESGNIVAANHKIFSALMHQIEASGIR